MKYFLELIIAPEDQQNFINNMVQHPLLGMDPAQLTQQATQARQAQAAVAQNAEASLGFLRTFLQPLFQRANDPAVADAFTISWQQQGSNTNIAAPLNDITALNDRCAKYSHSRRTSCSKVILYL